MKSSKKVRPADRLNESDREKYYVFTKLEFVKKAMIISLIIGALVFVLGAFLKNGALMLTGAVIITIFVILVFVHAYIKSFWEKLLRDSRKEKK